MSRQVPCYSVVVKKKREPLPVDAPVVQPEAASVVEAAAISLESRAKKPAGCIICGEESAPISSEGLCWVCRRLKLSAWRDSDSQMSAQE